VNTWDSSRSSRYHRIVLRTSMIETEAIWVKEMAERKWFDVPIEALLRRRVTAGLIIAVFVQSS
jgi:hypothetical protein